MILFIKCWYYDEIKCMTHCLWRNDSICFGNRVAAFDAMLIRWHLYVIMHRTLRWQNNKAREKRNRYELGVEETQNERERRRQGETEFRIWKSICATSSDKKLLQFDARIPNINFICERRTANSEWDNSLFCFFSTRNYFIQFRYSLTFAHSSSLKLFLWLVSLYPRIRVLRSEIFNFNVCVFFPSHFRSCYFMILFRQSVCEVCALMPLTRSFGWPVWHI